MGVSQFSLSYMIADFNKRNQRPHGTLLTLSRYDINFSKKEFIDICGKCCWEIDKNKQAELVEPLSDKQVFKCLGFERIESMDISGYEEANIIYDLNSFETPKELQNKYDFVLDGGTIEHIFHIHNVLKNIHFMLKIGGTFIFNQIFSTNTIWKISIK